MFNFLKENPSKCDVRTLRPTFARQDVYNVELLDSNDRVRNNIRSSFSFTDDLCLPLVHISSQQ